LLACRPVQCLDDGGLVAVITERVCATAAVGSLAAGDRVVRSCRRACPAQALVCRSGRGPAASGRLLGRGGIGKTRLREALSEAANPWGAGALGAVAGAGECATVLAVGAAIQADAVASLPLRLPGWLRSERSAPLFHPVTHSETTDPRSAESASLKLLFQKPADEPVMASPR
jgi:hypothetical protein